MEAGPKQGIGMIPAEINDLGLVGLLFCVVEVDCVDLLYRKIEARGHRASVPEGRRPKRLRAQVEDGFGGETDFIKRGLSHDGGRKGAPQVRPVGRRQCRRLAF